MLQFEGKKGVEFCDGLTRRDFLRVGALSAGALGLSLTDLAGAESRQDVNCIVLFLVGGPSHLDTWDPKPAAPTEVRGPFRPIHSRVPGMDLCETFPLMAGRAERFSLIRSVHHDEAPIHETGHQLMQTGRLFRGGQEFPHYGAALSHLRGPRQGAVPPFVVLPSPIGNTGVNVSHGQTSGTLGSRHDPFVLQTDPARLSSGKEMTNLVDAAHRAFDAASNSTTDDDAARRVFSSQAKRAFDLTREKAEVRTRYGAGTFGQSCLMARRLVENGARLVTVNMFDCVFNEITWDCHADGGALATTLDDYRDTLCPMLDRAYSTLLDDLTDRGMLDTTLVVAMGEFGRTPQLNPRGGRDHWPGCWTIALAGGGIKGGQIIGASDRTGSEPRDRPVTPAEVAATVYHSLGFDAKTQVPGPDGATMPLAEAEPIRELLV